MNGLIHRKDRGGRRAFLKRTVTATTALIVPGLAASRAVGIGARPPANLRHVMAGIGMGGRGQQVLREFMNQSGVQVVAVCDVQQQNLEQCRQMVDKHYGTQDCRTYTDYREVLARDDIDMILCATPDHWHAQVSIDACAAGKDVYCEKPLSLTIREGRKMVAAARRFGRVFSCGSQRVLQDYGRLACAARSGRFGPIVAAHCDPGGPSRPCYLPGAPIPDSMLDWDLWLGPAPWAPYHPYRCGRAYGLGGRGFRSWYDYSGGMMTDWGGHKFGAALHALGLDETGPSRIVPPDGKDIPYLTYEFANGMKIYHGGGMKYVGTEGEVKPQRELRVPPGLRWYSGGARTLVEDFMYCVRTRSRPFRDVEYAHRTATVCHLGNICYALERPLQWDPVKEDFVGDAEASRLVDRPRRGEWQI